MYGEKTTQSLKLVIFGLMLGCLPLAAEPGDRPAKAIEAKDLASSLSRAVNPYPAGSAQWMAFQLQQNAAQKASDENSSSARSARAASPSATQLSTPAMPTLQLPPPVEIPGLSSSGEEIASTSSSSSSAKSGDIPGMITEAHQRSVQASQDITAIATSQADVEIARLQSETALAVEKMRQEIQIQLEALARPSRELSLNLAVVTPRLPPRQGIGMRLRQRRAERTDGLFTDPIEEILQPGKTHSRGNPLEDVTVAPPSKSSIVMDNSPKPARARLIPDSSQ